MQSALYGELRFRYCHSILHWWRRACCSGDCEKMKRTIPTRRDFHGEFPHLKVVVYACCRCEVPLTEDWRCFKTCLTTPHRRRRACCYGDSQKKRKTIAHNPYAALGQAPCQHTCTISPRLNDCLTPPFERQLQRQHLFNKIVESHFACFRTCVVT